MQLSRLNYLLAYCLFLLLAYQPVVANTTSHPAALATVQTSSTIINNQGNLSHALNDLDHSDTYKGLAVFCILHPQIHFVPLCG